MSTATIEREFAVSAERLWDALADQDSLGTWLGAKVSVPVRGANGLVGTERRIHLGPLRFDERIAVGERPSALDYAIVPPLPLLRRHRGEMRVEQLGPARAKLRWRVTLELALRLDVLVLPFVMQALALGLRRLARRLESGRS